jgi:hypothetical protein
MLAVQVGFVLGAPVFSPESLWISHGRFSKLRKRKTSKKIIASKEILLCWSVEFLCPSENTCSTLYQAFLLVIPLRGDVPMLCQAKEGEKNCHPGK